MEDLIKEFLKLDLTYGSGDGSGSKLKTLEAPIVLSEYRKGFLDKQIASLKSFNGRAVHYIDNIPCYFLAIKDNVAKVEIIKDDFTIQRQYIAKRGNLFAHGNSKKEALQEISNKYFSSLSFTEKKAEFIEKFKKSDSHKAKVFFDWHHVLTGSCKSGRLNFVQSRGINLDSEMSVLDFLNLTQNEYNGKIIQEILTEIN